MLKKSIIILVILLSSLLVNTRYRKIEKQDNNILVVDDKFINFYGYLSVPSINMYLGFYDFVNPLNNVDKNIEYINTGLDNVYLLAGHSGIGKNAYFNDLRYLKIDDDIYLEFENNTLHFKINNIYREIKNGQISIRKDENQVILTTCDQIYKGYQLIIEGIMV